MEALSHVPDLLGDGVAVHHEDDCPGRGGECLQDLTSDTLVAWNIHQLHAGLALHWERHLVVSHGGVGLHQLGRDEL